MIRSIGHERVHATWNAANAAPARDRTPHIRRFAGCSQFRLPSRHTFSSRSEALPAPRPPELEGPSLVSETGWFKTV